MTTAVLPHQNRKPWVPALALILAFAAVVIAVIALAIAPAGVARQVPAVPATTQISRPPVHLQQPAPAIDCRAHRAGTAC